MCVRLCNGPADGIGNRMEGHFRMSVIRIPMLCRGRENVIFLLTSVERVQYYLSKEYCYLTCRQRGIILILISCSVRGGGTTVILWYTGVIIGCINKKLMVILN